MQEGVIKHMLTSDNPFPAVDLFQRTALLVGEEAMSRLESARIILFGVGGVGSWCAEALIRSGVGRLTIVDPDKVDVSNINRQLPATVTTVGLPKVEVLRERLLDINPQAEIVARCERFTVETAERFDVKEYDFVIDAIDSMADKLGLILLCTKKNVKWSEESVHRPWPQFFSSMGAARKMDPTQVRVSEFWKVNGCPLAATLRKRMRRTQCFPERKFLCVWSPERIEEAQPKGTLMPVTATFGLVLASLVFQNIVCQH